MAGLLLLFLLWLKRESSQPRVCRLVLELPGPPAARGIPFRIRKAKFPVTSSWDCSAGFGWIYVLFAGWSVRKSTVHSLSCSESPSHFILAYDVLMLLITYFNDHHRAAVSFHLFTPEPCMCCSIFLLNFTSSNTEFSDILVLVLFIYVIW